MKIITQSVLRQGYFAKLALVCVLGVLLQLWLAGDARGETEMTGISITTVGPETTVTLTANAKGPDYTVSAEQAGTVFKVDLKDTDWHVTSRAQTSGAVTNYSVKPSPSGDFNLLLNVKSGVQQVGTGSWEGSGSSYKYQMKFTDGSGGSASSSSATPTPTTPAEKPAAPPAPVIAGDPDAAKADAIRARHQMKQQQNQRDANSKWQDVSADVSIGDTTVASSDASSGKPATPMQIWEKSLEAAEGKDLALEAAKDVQKVEEQQKLQEQIETFDETETYESNMHSFLGKIGLGSGKSESTDQGEDGLLQYKSFADGFYVGVAGTLEEGLVKQIMQTSQSTANLDGGANTYRGAIFAGAGVTWQSLYFGGEAAFYPGSVSHVRKYHSTVAGDPTTTSTEAFKNTWSLAGRIGALASPTSLFYSKLGITGGTLSHSVTNAADLFSTPNNNTRSITGLLLGLGSEVRLAPHITGRVEMNYNDYGKFSNSSTTYSTEYRYRNNQYNIGLAYHFGDDVQDDLSDVNTAALEPEAYFGFGAGGHSASVGHEVTAPPGLFQYDANNLAAGMQLYMGYGQPLGRFYVGGEVSYSPLAYTFQRSLNVNTLSNSTEHLRHLFLTSARLGYYISQDTMVYGRLGWSTGAFTAASSASNTLYIMPDNFKQRINGIAFGGGVETAISKHMRLRTDLVHTVYPTISRSVFNPNLGGSGTQMQTKYTPQNTAFNVGVSFAFGPGAYWPTSD